MTKIYRQPVDETADGQRVDAFVRRFLPELPAHVVREAFARRDVKVDGARVKPDARLRVGQEVTLYCPEPLLPPLDVVYEDADVLLVNKRPGISVERDAHGGACLVDVAARYLRKADPNAGAPIPCHRLDNQTGGLLLLAKHEAAADILFRVFRERTLDKRYLCLVRGQMKPSAATCRAYLLKDARSARVTVTDRPVPGGKPIITAYETLESGPVSRLRVHLITGRTHQIRAHLAALGHPLLGDDVYGDWAFNRAQGARRLMLCAAELTLDTQGALPQLDGRVFTVPCPF